MEKPSVVVAMSFLRKAESAGVLGRVMDLLISEGVCSEQEVQERHGRLRKFIDDIRRGVSFKKAVLKYPEFNVNLKAN